ncbi:hypothetical protein SNEBB_010730 [Seison nebaliae]|nr:hypothetical protein SNEBB_010730 [Seison nebaliae]
MKLPSSTLLSFLLINLLISESFSLNCYKCRGWRCINEQLEETICPHQCKYQNILWYKIFDCGDIECVLNAHHIPVIGWFIGLFYTRRCCSKDMCNDGE